VSGKRLEKRIEELEIQLGIGSSAEQYVLRIIFGQGMRCKGDYCEVRWLMARDGDPKGRFVRVLDPGEMIGDEPSWLGADDVDPGT
jgi:hypothetical protein